MNKPPEGQIHILHDKDLGEDYVYNNGLWVDLNSLKESEFDKGYREALLDTIRLFGYYMDGTFEGHEAVRKALLTKIKGL